MLRAKNSFSIIELRSSGRRAFANCERIPFTKGTIRLWEKAHQRVTPHLATGPHFATRNNRHTRPKNTKHRFVTGWLFCRAEDSSFIMFRG